MVLKATPDLWKRYKTRGGLVSRPAIQRAADEIARLFHPERIYLFGSYAYGHPDPESDVDMLVVMPARNEIDQSVKIADALDPPFPFDILVRTPYRLAWRLKEGDWFLREVVGKGKVLYEKTNAGVVKKSRKRSNRRTHFNSKQPISS